MKVWIGLLFLLECGNIFAGELAAARCFSPSITVRAERWGRFFSEETARSTITVWDGELLGEMFRAFFEPPAQESGSHFYKWTFLNGGGGWLRVTAEDGDPLKGRGKYLWKLGEPLVTMRCDLTYDQRGKKTNR